MMFLFQGTEQLQLLQDKITILQQRHESREMTLQTLIRDLLRNRTQCKDCKNDKGKNRQLCYFRQELDHILGMLQEITNVHWLSLNREIVPKSRSAFGGSRFVIEYCDNFYKGKIRDVA